MIIDYGKNNNIGNTLQSVKNHKYSDPLKYQGESDLSSLVNFEAIKNYSKEYNLVVTKLINQGDFLKSLGRTSHTMVEAPLLIASTIKL